MRLEDIKNNFESDIFVLNGDYIQNVTLNTLYDYSEADENSEECYLSITLGNFSSSEEALNFLEQVLSSSKVSLTIRNLEHLDRPEYYTTYIYYSSNYKCGYNSGGKLTYFQIIFFENGNRCGLIDGSGCIIKGEQKDFTFSLPRTVTNAYKTDRIVCKLYF